MEFSFIAQLLFTILSAHLAHRLYLRLTRSSRLCRHFRNRHVWVIGASQGLGRAISERLHLYGAQLTISSRSIDRLKPVSAACGNCNILPLDISSGYTTVSHAYATARAQREVDDVIANAGVNHNGQQFTTLEASDINRVIDTNLRGVAHLFHAAMTGGMRNGTLVAISSLAAYRGVPGASVYGASKAALSTMCTALNVELIGRDGDLRVVAVHPGFVDTPAIRHLDHPKPFLLSEMEAADLVLDAVACRQRHYGFPWIMEHVVTRFQRVVPTPIYEYLMYYTA